MRSIGLMFLILAALGSPFRQASASSRQTRDRMAQKACLAGDPDKGVEILAELYLDSNNLTHIFNQGRCFEQNHRYDDAIARFREYLVKGEDRLSAEEEAAAKKRINACQSYLPKSEQPPALVVPAPVSSPETPIPAPAAPEPPRTTTPPERQQQPDRHTGGGLRTAGVVVASVGAAALITGVILNLKVNSMSKDLEKPDNFNRDTDNSRKNYKTLGWVSYGVGAACLAGGSLFYYLGWRSGRGSEADVAVIPTVAADLAGISLTGAF